MKTKQLLLTITCLFAVSAIQAQHQLILQPNATDGKDAKVRGRSDELNLNIPDDKVIHLYAWTNNTVPNKQRIFIQFDWSALPQNAVIDSAVLSMFHTSLNNTPDHSGANAFSIRRVTSHWAEDSITWNNQPGVDTTNQVFIPQSTNSTQDYHMNVTQLVKDMVSSGTNYGFRMALNDESPYRNVSLASSDHPDSTKHPKLVIYYTTSNTAVEAIEANTNVMVYPNPSEGVVTFYFTESVIKSGMISIYSLSGQLVKQVDIENSDMVRLQCEDLTNGLYIFKVEKGLQTVKTGKFVIQK